MAKTCGVASFLSNILTVHGGGVLKRHIPNVGLRNADEKEKKIHYIYCN